MDSEKTKSTPIVVPVFLKSVLKDSGKCIASNIQLDDESSVQTSKNSDPEYSISYVQISDNSMQSAILDHPYPVTSMDEKTVCLPISTSADLSAVTSEQDCLQSQPETAELSVSDMEESELMCVEILPDTENHEATEMPEKSHNPVLHNNDEQLHQDIPKSQDEKVSTNGGDVKLLMEQQEHLIKQQGQMLQVLQELRDIQKDLLGLKRKSHELKLTKLRIIAQQSGVKVITKASR